MNIDDREYTEFELLHKVRRKKKIKALDFYDIDEKTNIKKLNTNIMFYTTNSHVKVKLMKDNVVLDNINNKSQGRDIKLVYQLDSFTGINKIVNQLVRIYTDIHSEHIDHIQKINKRISRLRKSNMNKKDFTNINYNSFMKIIASYNFIPLDILTKITSTTESSVMNALQELGLNTPLLKREDIFVKNKKAKKLEVFQKDFRIYDINLNDLKDLSEYNFHNESIVENISKIKYLEDVRFNQYIAFKITDIKDKLFYSGNDIFIDLGNPDDIFEDIFPIFFSQEYKTYQHNSDLFSNKWLEEEERLLVNYFLFFGRHLVSYLINKPLTTIQCKFTGFGGRNLQKINKRLEVLRELDAKLYAIDIEEIMNNNKQDVHKDELDLSNPLRVLRNSAQLTEEQRVILINAFNQNTYKEKTKKLIATEEGTYISFMDEIDKEYKTGLLLGVDEFKVYVLVIGKFNNYRTTLHPYTDEIHIIGEIDSNLTKEEVAYLVRKEQKDIEDLKRYFESKKKIYG